MITRDTTIRYLYILKFEDLTAIRRVDVDWYLGPNQIFTTLFDSYGDYFYFGGVI